MAGRRQRWCRLLKSVSCFCSTQANRSSILRSTASPRAKFREQAWPSQPRPVKPPPYARQSMRSDELTDVTPESQAFCGKLVEQSLLGELYTPIGLRSTILFPGANGGANWAGASYDPESHTLYVNSMEWVPFGR